MNNRDQIIASVLSLGPEDRAFVADAIEESLVGNALPSPVLSDAWAKEINQRLEAYDRGEAAAVDGANLLSIREQLARHRSQGIQD